MCAEGSEACLEDAIGECPECGGLIDSEGYSVEERCNYSRDPCTTCGNAPCSGYC